MRTPLMKKKNKLHGRLKKKRWAAPLFSKVHFFSPMTLVSLSASPTKKNRIAHECALKKRATRTCKKRSKPILPCCFHFENMNKAQNKKHEEATQT